MRHISTCTRMMGREESWEGKELLMIQSIPSPRWSMVVVVLWRGHVWLPMVAFNKQYISKTYSCLYILFKHRCYIEVLTQKSEACGSRLYFQTAAPISLSLLTSVSRQITIIDPGRGMIILNNRAVLNMEARGKTEREREELKWLKRSFFLAILPSSGVQSKDLIFSYLKAPQSSKVFDW